MTHKYYSTILIRKSIQFLFQGFKKPYKKMYSNDLKILSIIFKNKQLTKLKMIICYDSIANVEKTFDRKHEKVFINGNIIYLTHEVKKGLELFFCCSIRIYCSSSKDHNYNYFRTY